MVVNTEKELGVTDVAGPSGNVHFPDLQALFDHLFELKCQGAVGCEAYGEAAYDYTINKQVVIPKGTTVRFVMVSRFGDLGITTDLNKQYGYDYRIHQLSNAFTNLRLQR